MTKHNDCDGCGETGCGTHTVDSESYCPACWLKLELFTAANVERLMVQAQAEMAAEYGVERAGRAA